jgi:DNA-binding NarL/FixJ family response regulator
MTAASTTTYPAAAKTATRGRPASQDQEPYGTAPDGRTREGTAPGQAVPGTPLSPEDLELLRMLADGVLIGAVARHLRTSERTVRRRIRGICDRLGVDAPIQAVVWAARLGLL